MKKNIFILSFSALVYFSSANKAAFITKCKWDDSKCIKDTTQAAIPIMADGIQELGVEKMDPIHIKNVDASTPNLKLQVKDIKVTGLKNCEALKMEREISKSLLDVSLLCTAAMEGKYEMDGQLLILPIKGNGDMIVNLNKILINAVVELEEKKDKDSEVHWNIKKWEHKFELKDKSKVEFSNLFDGNEVLAKAVKEMIAENGNEIISEIGPPIIKAVVAKVAKNCNNFFHAVPLKDLVLS